MHENEKTPTAQHQDEKKRKVIASCQSCLFDGEIELPWEKAVHLLVVDCPKCLGRKTLTPRELILLPGEESIADAQKS